VRRPEEWGPAGPPDPVPHPACDLVVDGFAELAEVLEAWPRSANSGPRSDHRGRKNRQAPGL